MEVIPSLTDKRSITVAGRAEGLRRRGYSYFIRTWLSPDGTAAVVQADAEGLCYLAEVQAAEGSAFTLFLRREVSIPVTEGSSCAPSVEWDTENRCCILSVFEADTGRTKQKAVTL